MRILILTVSVLYALSIGCVGSAPDQAIADAPLEQVQEAIPKDVQALLPDQLPNSPFYSFQQILELINRAWVAQLDSIRHYFLLILRAFALVSLCQLVTLSEHSFSVQIAAMTAALGLMACCGPSILSCISITRVAIDKLANFSNVFLPVIASLAFSAGGPATASATYLITLLFSNLLAWLSRLFLFPWLIGICAFSMIDSALRQRQLEHLCQISSSVLSKILKLFLWSFTGILAVTGMVTEAQDAAALKAVQFSISASIPVVGSMISDAAGTLLSSAVFLKTSVGSLGMMAILCVVLAPLIQLAAFYLLMKLLCILCGILASPVLSFVETLSNALGYLMAILSCCAYISLLASVNFVRMVQP